MPLPTNPATFDAIEPMDPELLYLLVSTNDSRNSLVATKDVLADVPVDATDDDMMPLNMVVSTPTGVEAYNPGFSNGEMEDLMSLLLPERAGDAALLQSSVRASPATKKFTKRTKKCTYAARRREVAALRSEVASLEKTLGSLRIKHEPQLDWELRAVGEKRALENAQSENARLQAIVADREAKIRKLDAYVSSVSRR